MKLMLARYKKSQAAMEFLMTYGWAIIVVLAAIAALAYFGVLSPEKFFGERCLLEPGFSCIGIKVESTQSTIILLNGYGKTVTIDEITIGDCTEAFTTDNTLISEAEATFVIDPAGCDNGEVK